PEMDDIGGGSILLILNVPEGSLIGINLLSFTTTPRFHGIKHLPPGFHFVFTSVSNTQSIRQGVWVEVPRSGSRAISQYGPHIILKKWDPTTESLVDETSDSERLRHRANLGAIWREGLVPYLQSADTADEEAQEQGKEEWAQMTTHVSARLLDRVLGERTWALNSASTAPTDAEKIPGISAEEHQEKELGFLVVDLRRTWKEDATGRERTEAARDRSWALGEAVEKHCWGSWDEVVGEMEVAFLMVMTLNNYSCLEQWKRLLELAMTSKAAVKDHPGFFVDVMEMLRLQLEKSRNVEGGGLFDLSDDGAPFLKDLLKKFRRGLDDLDGKAKADVLDELDELEHYLKEVHKWEIDAPFLRTGILELEDGETVEMDAMGRDDEDEEGEYAPQIVELTAEQANALGHDHQAKKSEDELALAEEEEEEQDLEEMDARF
ncbi:hypothetical protein P152DRAFT_391246, partial [Eremomyces bilateralis CBS 781.70]